MNYQSENARNTHPSVTINDHERDITSQDSAGSYKIHESDPVQNLPVRMLDQGVRNYTDRFYNTPEKLIRLITYDVQPVVNDSKYRNQQKKSFQIKNKEKKCLLSLFLCCILFLILIEIIFLFLGVLFTSNCTNVGNYLILSAISHIVLIFCETIRCFFRQVYKNSASRKKTDICIVLVLLILTILYIVTLIWYTIGFSWIWIPYTELVFVGRNSSISIIHNGRRTNIKMKHCQVWILHCAMMYQLYCFGVILIRMIFCCYGNSCKDIVLKSLENSTIDNLKVPYLATNKLHGYIPTIKDLNKGSYITQLKQTNYGTVHDKVNCMIFNHPKWVHL